LNWRGEQDGECLEQVVGDELVDLRLEGEVADDLLVDLDDLLRLFYSEGWRGAFRSLRLVFISSW
jgi:hypothetical protein